MFLINPYIYSTSAWVDDYSVLFGGTDESANLGNVTELDSTANFSISFWVKKRTSGTGTYQAGTYIGASDFVGIWQMSSPVGVLRFSVDAGAVRCTTAITIDTWFHIVAVFDGSLTGNVNRAKIYVDGVNETTDVSGTIPATRAAGGQDFKIGTLGNLSTTHTTANFDEFRVYDYSLSASDVTDIYNSGVPKADDLATLAVHKYRMGDGDTFPTLLDSGTGTTLNGTMTNMESGDIELDTP